MATGIYKTFCSPSGEITKELSELEVAEWAAMGDTQCKKYKLKQAVQTAVSIADIKAALVNWI